MTSETVPTVSFVKRAVLQSNDGGNSYDVEVEDTSSASAPASGKGPAVPLYEQLAKTISDRRNLPATGRPEELTIEDQEFVNRLMQQREQEAAHYEEEAREFKRQKILTATTTANSNSSINHREVEESSTNKSEEDEVVVIVKKKKKKQAASS